MKEGAWEDQGICGKAKKPGILEESVQGKEDPRSGQRGNRTGRREGCVSHWKDFMRKSVKLLDAFAQILEIILTSLLC